MGGPSEAMQAHLASGVTTLCRCWAILRKDGVRFGFTDHDCMLEFDGFTFKADSGLTAAALEQSTGLSVDNSEALGALSDAAVREEDIEAGRFDGAEVLSWLVNWAEPEQRWLQFRGSIGELRRGGGAFQAELRGLTDALNQPLGRVFQKPCTAVLGDGGCRFDLDQPGYRAEIAVEQVEDGRVFRWTDLSGFEPGWFQRGRLDVTGGAAAGLWALIKSDKVSAAGREIELWEPIRAALRPGDGLRLTAGCDKRMETCRLKFNNLLNFQGFPDLPREDWVMATPKRTGANSGGSLR
ncbi:DUF2163 domain-containing protein [Ruegeria pomeroyi]|uniref:Bacteriophage phiJL001 Gp84 C-terminal domain-containing protein n=3 Tax=root TaxID=1 RepID=Q5LR77_RUEPO|nr:DUF2163 domain-containing protein [Ruegeria pomeroyi]DBA12297.1 TPA_asm: DUF2163 domain-containing protein [Ruegerigtaviriform cheni]AAV95518.1 gene transfer agent [Ruegeria pomeroyi DSS-3]NVK97122.1 DUF2163 domain-containing protein [Ruegeria pomeroyi]NVL00442.1 DUF2163 domain-containing protein [Ruegeria pomeroyi]QWV09097.1 DUF2163 domain-containing protein [Ruegeria pomeroyi]